MISNSVHIHVVFINIVNGMVSQAVLLCSLDISYIAFFCFYSPAESDVATPVMGQFKYDMGWQKRGAGRSYDSKSGVGTMIGNLSGKVYGFGVRSKDCRKCTYHIKKGQIPPDHKCSKIGMALQNQWKQMLLLKL